jgi:hypothetical protein
MGDCAQTRLRTLVQSNVPGTTATSPFGTITRALVIIPEVSFFRVFR